jgi:hypothetical protein
MKEKDTSTRSYNNFLRRISEILVQSRGKIFRETNRGSIIGD